VQQTASNAEIWGVIGNEPSLQCGVIPYTIIGAILVMVMNGYIYECVSSEMGRFDDE
jgi:hypothetical protein